MLTLMCRCCGSEDESIKLAMSRIDTTRRIETDLDGIDPTKRMHHEATPREKRKCKAKLTKAICFYNGRF